jgi:hypothetical protein
MAMTTSTTDPPMNPLFCGGSSKPSVVITTACAMLDHAA